MIGRRSRLLAAGLLLLGLCASGPVLADDIWGDPAQGVAGKVKIPDTASWRKLCTAHFATLRETDERHQLMRQDVRLSLQERERQWADYSDSRDETSRLCAGTYPEFAALAPSATPRVMPGAVCGGRITFRDFSYDPVEVEGRAVVVGPKGETHLSFDRRDFSVEVPAPRSGTLPAVGDTLLLTKAPRSTAEFAQQIASLLDRQCDKALSASGGGPLLQVVLALLRAHIGQELRPCVGAAPDLARALGCPFPQSYPEGVTGARG